MSKKYHYERAMSGEISEFYEVAMEKMKITDDGVSLSDLFHGGNMQLVYVYWNMVKFRDAGKHVFEVGPYMAKTLSSMDVPDCEMIDIKPPYECFYIGLTDGLERLRLKGETTDNPIEGMYVTFVGEGDDKSILDQTFCNVLLTTSDASGDDATMRYNIPKTNNVRQSIDDMLKHSFTWYDEADEHMKAQGCEIVYRTFCLVVNFIIYLQTRNRSLDEFARTPDENLIARRTREVKDKVNALERTRPSRERLIEKYKTKILKANKRLLAAESTPQVHVVNPEGEMKALEISKRDRSECRLHDVRAHYRRYWYGSGSSRHREWVFVDTFERGNPEVGGKGRESYEVPEDREFFEEKA